ncbi:MAG TPA: pyrroline-5-carboxylate reductase dimerization domain-containing protein [Terriglobales bacterium]|nr:pyrroline-5-carboxylate reductase dimerization domain-containing protein [Terriglobales bacterium]
MPRSDQKRSLSSATVFLGGGRITSALICGLRRAGYKSLILVHDRNAPKLRRLTQEFDAISEPDPCRAVSVAGLLVVAVRPDSIGTLLAALRHSCPRPNRSLIAVSLAAGVPLTKLRVHLPQVHWARAMPSPVCRTGRGLTAVTFDRSVPGTARRLVRNFFAHVGTVLEIPEKNFDVFTATYSPSHGYHALATLAEAAEKLGLDRDHALIAAAHALADAIAAFRQEKIPLEELLYEAATPGGIAATVMDTENRAGYKRIIERALRAGVQRARKNARG